MSDYLLTNEGDSVDFKYTGAKQTMSLLSGTYKIECWGAEGGSANGNPGTSGVGAGGKGAYVSAIVFLNEPLDIIYAVGEMPVALPAHSGDQSCNSGGGMSAVAIKGSSPVLDIPLVVAGGGVGGTEARFGMSRIDHPNMDGKGLGGSQGSGGGGWTTNGSSYPGISWVNGLGPCSVGGYANMYASPCTFGGGGGGGDDGGGGGAGYYGGNYGRPGSGGYSYVTSDYDISNVLVTPGQHYGNGEITITFIQGFKGYATDLGVISTKTSIDLVQNYVEGVTCSQMTFNKAVLMYLVSTDKKQTWKKYDGTNWVIINKSDIATKGMLKEDIECITSEQWNKLIGDTLDIAIGFVTNTQYLSPMLYNIQVKLKPKTARQDIRYAFSFNKQASWMIFKNNIWTVITEDEIINKGMTSNELSLLDNTIWSGYLKDSLDILIGILNNDKSDTPVLNSFAINYEQLNETFISDIMHIPIPALGFKNILTNEIDIVYTLTIADGIAFDDKDIDYNFYTTADRIQLRPLDMGVMIGGRQQNIFGVEVINGYTDKNFSVILRGATPDGKFAEDCETYALLYDSDTQEGRTKFEISLDQNNFGTYPITFNLNASERKIVYIKITPTIYNTVGTKQVKLKLVARQL